MRTTTISRGSPWHDDPPAGRGEHVTVVGGDSRACRVLRATRADDVLHVEVFEEAPMPASPSSAAALLRRMDLPGPDVVVVTAEVRPTPAWASREASSGPATGAVSVDDERRTATERGCCARWAEALDGVGLRLVEVHPLVGSALSGIRFDTPHRPSLVVQVEEECIAIIEAVGPSCRGLEVHACAPTAERCMRLIGDGCPEVLLCGGGTDLSRLGYEVALMGRTWVRLPKLLSTGVAVPSAAAAMVGAARHALGIIEPGAIAHIRPRGRRTEGTVES